MTLIAIWTPDFASIWCVADTRISNENSVLTDRGTKITPLTMNCYEPDRDTGFFTDLTFRRTFGFCYSGSSLIAHLACDTLSMALSNLARTQDGPPPSLEDVGSLASRIMTAYLRDVGAIYQNTKTEAALFGRCPRSGDLSIIHLQMGIDATRAYVTSNQVPPSRDCPLLLGDSNAKEAISEALPIGSLLANPFAPFSQLERLISQGKLGSVGGSCQAGVVFHNDFQPFALVRPVEKGAPQATFKFLGFDMDRELGNVGGFRIGITGFAGPPALED